MDNLQDPRAPELRRIFIESLQSHQTGFPRGWQLALALDLSRHPEFYSHEFPNLKDLITIPAFRPEASEFYRQILFGRNQELTALADALETVSDDSPEARNLVSFLDCELCVQHVVDRLTEVHPVKKAVLMRILTNEFDGTDFSILEKSVLNLSDIKIQRLADRLVSVEDDLRVAAYDFFSLHKKILAAGLRPEFSDFTEKQRRLANPLLDELVKEARELHLRSADIPGSSTDPCADALRAIINKQ